MGNDSFLDTVDWIGDGDERDFFLDIEQIFDLKLRRELPWTTFGQVLDHVDAVVRRRGSGSGCASQMAFYRVRDAIGASRTAGPKAPLTPYLAEPVKRQFNDLEADTGLAMPRLHRGWGGWLGVLLAVAALMSIVMLRQDVFGIMLAGAFALAAWAMLANDGKRVPRQLATIGDLAEAVADRNRGRLATQGARLTREEMWTIIQELGASEGGQNPRRIQSKTTFFKAAAAVAA